MSSAVQPCSRDDFGWSRHLAPLDAQVPMKNVASEERHLELPEVTHFVEEEAEGCLEEGCSVEEIEKIQLKLEHDEGWMGGSTAAVGSILGTTFRGAHEELGGGNHLLRRTWSLKGTCLYFVGFTEILMSLRIVYISLVVMELGDQRPDVMMLGLRDGQRIPGNWDPGFPFRSSLASGVTRSGGTRRLRR
eukprot:Skav203046  [mRNA]  locus=scaffold845:92349:96017:+ [translate_table: standard]